MRKLSAALLLFFGLVSAALAQQTDRPPLYCTSEFQVNQAAVALTKIISGTSGQSIGICGVALSGGAAASTFSMSYGTGTNCATGAVVMMPLINIGVNASYIDHVPFVNLSPPSQNTSAVANDVCVVTTGTGPLSIIVYYIKY
jgi:hypothetical protein